MSKILSTETIAYQEHDEGRLRYLRKVETRLVEDGTFSYTGSKLETSQQYYNLFSSLTSRDREVAVILFLDKYSNPIGYDVWTGGIDFVSIDPRQVFKIAAFLNASQLVICHTHPEGRAEPSVPDQMFCLQISNLCLLLGWKLRDFLVLTVGNYYSFKDSKNPTLIADFPESGVKI